MLVLIHHLLNNKENYDGNFINSIIPCQNNVQIQQVVPKDMAHGFQPYSIGCLLPRLKDRSHEADLHFFELILYMIFEKKISLILHQEKINGLLGKDFLHKVLALLLENGKKEQ